MTARAFLGCLAAASLASCGGRTEALRVKSYHLHDRAGAAGGEALLRMERKHRLHGAVTRAEQEERKGHYFTVFWRDLGRDRAAGRWGAVPARVVFEYRQANPGSRVMRKERSFPAAARSGKVEFRVTGKAYREGGRVTSWRVSYYRGGTLLDRQRSFLWE